MAADSDRAALEQDLARALADSSALHLSAARARVEATKLATRDPHLAARIVAAHRREER